MLAVASWNVNSIRARLDHVRAWLEAESVDVLALQETKVRDEDFPAAVFESLGYHSACVGQKSYNGVAVLSRAPVSVLAREIPGFGDPQARVLAVETAGLAVLDVYVPNGASVGSDKYSYKLAWLDALAGWIEQLLASHAGLLALGLVDVFREFEQAPATFSWWDYRAGGFRRNHGLRIDLILASATLRPRLQACRIDAAPRRLDKPSDHAPVVALIAAP